MKSRLLLVACFFPLLAFTQLEFKLKGTVVVINTGKKQKISGATVKLVGSDNTSTEVKTDKKGRYEFSSGQVKPNTSYVVSASALDVDDKFSDGRGYLGNPKAKFTTIGLLESKVFIQNFELMGPRGPERFVPFVLFNKDSSTITATMKDSLELILRLLFESPNIVIEVGGNCMKGEKDVLNLSKQRAQKAVDYFVVRGISPERLVIAAHSDTLPYYMNGKKLDEKGIKKLSKTKDKREEINRLNTRLTLRILRKDYAGPYFSLSGHVTESMSKVSIPCATVKLVGSDTTAIETKSDSLGWYHFDSIQVKKNTNYVVSASALDVKLPGFPDGFLGNPKAKISTMNKNVSEAFRQDFELKKMLASFILPMIHFDKNSDSLTPYIIAQLDTLTRFMDEHSEIVLEISCHASFDEKEPQMLTFNRAKKIVDYLVRIKEIEPERIFPAGYGSSKPAILWADLKLPGGKIVPKGTEFTSKWIVEHYPRTKYKNDYEFLLRLNRRVTLSIIRRDFVSKKTVQYKLPCKIE